MKIYFEGLPDHINSGMKMESVDKILGAAGAFRRLITYPVLVNTDSQFWFLKLTKSKMIRKKHENLLCGRR